MYLKALFWDLSSFHCILFRWAHSFLHSDLIIIYMLMTLSYSYPSRQPSSVITFPVCRLLLAPSQTGWPQICSVSTAQILNSCWLVSSLNWIKYKVLHFVWVGNSISVLPSASASNLGFIFDSNLTLADQISSVSRSWFYRIRDFRRIRLVLDFTTAQSIGTSCCSFQAWLL